MDNELQGINHCPYYLKEISSIKLKYNSYSNKFITKFPASITADPVLNP